MTTIVKNGYFTSNLTDWSFSGGGTNAGVYTPSTISTSPNFANSRTVANYPIESGLIDTSPFFAFNTQDTVTPQILKQTVTLPYITSGGSYILTFWAVPSSIFDLRSPLNVSFGSKSLFSIIFTTASSWIKYRTYISVEDSSQLTQDLNFSLTSYNTNINCACVTGITITYDPPCFREGTFITCQKEGVETEVPIEKLKDAPYLVKTLKHGFLPVHSIGKSLLHNPGNRERIQERLYKLTPLNYPEIYTPLYLTGSHGILVPSLTDQEIKVYMEQYEGKLFVTDGHYRLFTCMDNRAEPYDQEGDFNIYHIALQSENQEINYGIYANGLLVESCSIWSLTEKHKHVEIISPGTILN